MTMEDLIIKKIQGGFLAVKNGNAEPKSIAPWLNRLKPINPGMYEEFLQKYKSVINK